MVKGARRSNVGYVYGAMEELQQLREEVAMLREKNHSLAKQLNVTKMELAREFKRQEVQVALQLKALMKPPKKQMSGMADSGVQCDLSASENEESKGNKSVPGDAPRTPPRSRQATLSPSPQQSLSPTSKTRRRYCTHPSRSETLPADDDIQMQSPPPLRLKQRKPDTLPIHHENEVSGSLANELDVRRRLRFRSVEVSYVEPPRNRKIRQGDYYGLLKRPQTPRSHADTLPPMHHHQSAHTEEPTRSMRHRKPVSYVLPKLNTKLRQGDKFTFTT